MGDEKVKESGMYDKGTGRWLGGFGASWDMEDIEGKARQPRICRTIESTEPDGRPFYGVLWCSSDSEPEIKAEGRDGSMISGMNSSLKEASRLFLGVSGKGA